MPKDFGKRKDGRFYKKGNKNGSKDSDPSVNDGSSENIREDLEPDEPQQVRQKFDEDGDPIVDHTITVNGYDIDIPEDEEEYDVIDDFLDKNNLWKEYKVKAHDNDGNYNFEKLLTNGFENAQMNVGYPSGSCYLGTDGSWYGGEGAYGYDEDHRPQMQKAMTYAGIKLVSDDGHGDGGSGREGKLSSSENMIHALELSGFVRIGYRGDSINIDLFQPLTSSQRSALKEIVLEKGFGPDDVIVDTNDTDISEKTIQRSVGAFDNDYDFDDDY